jgi:hypothetical protein
MHQFIELYNFQEAVVGSGYNLPSTSKERNPQRNLIMVVENETASSHLINLKFWL